MGEDEVGLTVAANEVVAALEQFFFGGEFAAVVETPV